MGNYLIDTKEIYYSYYSVQADSEDEAVGIVMSGLASPVRVETSWYDIEILGATLDD